MIYWISLQVLMQPEEEIHNPRLTFLSWTQTELTRRTLLSHKFCPCKNELETRFRIKLDTVYCRFPETSREGFFLSNKIILPVLRTSGIWPSWRMLLTNEVKHLRALVLRVWAWRLWCCLLPGHGYFWGC